MPTLLSSRLSLALLAFFSGSITGRADTLAPQITVNEEKQFGLVEIHLPTDKTYTNPFDPDEITVQGHFQGPDGTTTDVDGFLDQDYTMNHGDSDKRDHVTPQGDPYWAVRYTPTQKGSYTWWVTEKDTAGDSESPKATFTTADDPGAPSFIHVAPNHTHFQDDRGAAFYPIGMNIDWATGGGMYDFENWFSEFSQNGGNAARVWMTWPGLPLEREKTPDGGWHSQDGGYLNSYVFPDLNERVPNGADDTWGGLGRIDLANAWRYDHMLELARKDGIRLMFCQFNSALAGDRWARSPYNKANGGMLNSANEFFTNIEAKATFKHRLRYVVARYGWSTNVLAWEFFNEIDALGHDTNTYPAADVAAWHKEMAQYLKQIDPNKHMVTTSTAYSEVESLYSIPEIDFAQGHLYNCQDSVPAIAQMNDKQTTLFGKPHLFGEFGLEFLQQGFFGGSMVDVTGINDETALWASMASPGAGTVFPWYWDNYIEPEKLWSLWKPVAQFAANVPWNKVQWKAAALPKMTYVAPSPDGSRATLRIVPPYRWEIPPHAFKVETNGTLDHDISDIPLYVRRASATDPLTFQVDYPQDGQFVVQIRCVGAKGATLEIRLDGQPVLTKDFPAGEKNFQFQYNGNFSIDVPGGPHKIQVANISDTPESLFSAEYDFAKYLDPEVVPLQGCGMLGDDNVGIFYFYNQDYTWGGVNAGNPIVPVAPSNCVIPGLKPGTYTVETWSPSEGKMLTSEQVSTTSDGLPLALPEIKNDLAIKILPGSP